MPRPLKCLPKFLPFEHAVTKVYSHKHMEQHRIFFRTSVEIGLQTQEDFLKHTDQLVSVWLAETLKRLACCAFTERFHFIS